MFLLCTYRMEQQVLRNLAFHVHYALPHDYLPHISRFLEISMQVTGLAVHLLNDR